MNRTFQCGKETHLQAACWGAAIWSALTVLAGGQVAAQTDAYGDPLPAGALVRIGTTRFRHGGSIMRLAFSPNGRILASGGLDQKIRLWEVQSGKELQSFLGYPLAVAFSPTGADLAISVVDGIRVMDVASGKEKKHFKDNGAHCALAFCPKGKLLASCSRQIVLWDLATGDKVASFQDDKDSHLTGFAFSPDGSRLASGSTDKTTRLWDVKTGKQLFCWTLAKSVESVAFSANGRLLASATAEEVVLWDLIDDKELLRVPGPIQSRVVFSPRDKSYLLPWTIPLSPGMSLLARLRGFLGPIRGS